MVPGVHDLKSIVNSPFPQYFSFQKLEIDFKCFAREVALKTNFQLICYRKHLESISSILRMRHSLVPLKTNFKLILYGKDLESVSSILRMGHSLVPLKTNFYAYPPW